MYKNHNIIAITGGFNEESKIGLVIKNIPSFIDEIIAIDDGSTDKTYEEIKQTNATVIKNKKNMGPGYVLKLGLQYAIKKKYDIAIIIAGDNQDNPQEIRRLIDKIIEGYDIVQGSRYLESTSKIPLFRKITTKLYSLFFRIIIGYYITDASNGFRAYKTSFLRNVDFTSDWLNGYELEPYLLIKAIRGKYKLVEVPVSKYYDKEKGYSKMRPFIDWFKICKPLVKEIFL